MTDGVAPLALSLAAAAAAGLNTRPLHYLVILYVSCGIRQECALSQSIQTVQVTEFNRPWASSLQLLLDVYECMCEWELEWLEREKIIMHASVLAQDLMFITAAMTTRNGETVRVGLLYVFSKVIFVLLLPFLSDYLCS